jgi:hypothetical protein
LGDLLYLSRQLVLGFLATSQTFLTAFSAFPAQIIPPAEILLPNPSTGESKGCPGVPAIDAMLVPAAQARQVFYAGLLATISALP